MAIDLLIDDANVITVDDSRPRAGSLPIHAGRAIAVGERGRLYGAPR